MSLPSIVLNILWLAFGGVWSGAGWLIASFLMAVTIIGIPFAWAHLKLARLSLWPVGYTIVDAETAARLKRA